MVGACDAAPVRYADAAARNNAEWCDLVCRSHGVDTRVDNRLWASLRRSPPLYPDAVTLSRDVCADEVVRRVDTSPGCSIKDSFASLDLSRYGFRVLFEAEWIRRPPGPLDATVGSDWGVVRSVDELWAWAAAHGGGAVFRPELLHHPAVTVLAVRQAGTVVGGAVANASDGGVVGVSNVFTVNDDVDRIWRGAVAAVSAHHRAATLVGYESGADLDAALGVGFVGAGRLRVWLRE
jgi:hypothetical protein